MPDLLIFPYNGNGLEALLCLGEDYNFIGFVDDTSSKLGKQDSGHIVYDRKALTDFSDAMVLAVPGSPTSFTFRKKIIDSLNLPISRFAKVIHPTAVVSPLARLGINTLIMPGVVLTSNCVVGDHVCVLPNTVVHHDCKIGDYTLIGSGVCIAGNTIIGRNCYIGSGSNIINGITVGDESLVGMGSNVIKKLPAGSKAVGNPARKL